VGGEEATGRGVYLTLMAAAADMGLNVQNTRAVVQGFGQVGSALASLLHATGCRIVAVTDVHGGIYNSGGIDIPKLIKHVQETGKVAKFDTSEPVDNEAIFGLDCDIAVPAAVQSVIHKGNAEKVKAKLIVEGANGPVTTEADAVLTARGITIVPDVVANSGGATVCHFERSQGLSDQYWDLDTVNAHLERRILNAYRYAKDAADDVGTGSLRLGAWVHALRKIEKAMQLRGWV